MRRISRIFGLAATYIGTVIGAGFASGQEIQVFFARYGLFGLPGLILAAIIFAAAGERALRHGAAHGRDSYYQTLSAIAGPCAPFFDLIMLFFLIVLGGVMLAGSGALAAASGFPSWCGVALTALLGLAVVGAEIPGLLAVNSIFVPCLLGTAAIIALRAPGGALPPAPGAAHLAWLPSALLYASYNSVLSLPVLTALGAAQRDPRIIRLGGLCGALGLLIAGALILTTLLRHPVEAARTEVPMAAIASSLGGPFGRLYGAVLWGEMFTTLVADVYGAAARLRQLLGGPRLFHAVLAMALGIALSGLGFARLVRTAYPAFGLVCMAVLFRLFRPRRRHNLRPAGKRAPIHG
ncbi:MAG: hypothetical protein ACM3XS_07665 [Bacteroidota bacterium]